MNLITAEVIREAAERISPFIIRTPIIRFRYLERIFKVPIYLKCENLQITRSFKVRGAFNALLTLEVKERGVVTRSSGNFAQAVSYAAKLMDIPATIVMPTNAPQVKIDRTREFGVAPLLFGRTHQEAEIKVAEIANEQGKYVLSPYNHERVVAGQGTAGLEIIEELPDLQTYLCPVGGGGLAAGTTTAIKSHSKSILTIGIEPSGAADYFAYRKSGVLEPLAEIVTIADGLRAPVVGSIPLPYLDKNVDQVEIVGDGAIESAMLLLKQEFGMIVEPSGATALAYLVEKPRFAFAGPVVVMISGGNFE